jgi:ParB family transcriptional regulator, chromosome partitioning protein
MTMLDLSALDQDIEPGKPLSISIDLIIEDPNQPRQEFDEKALRELAEDIKERGVKNPISVKPLNAEGFYILNAGARRRRAAILAGLSNIPAFIDQDFTDYDQVNENEQRENLSPMELALFIDKRLKAGDKAHEIAKKLRKSNSEITCLKALIDLPDCLMQLLRSGRCASPRFLYDLKNLYDSAPDKVTTWLNATEEITAKNIIDLKAIISPASKPTEPSQTEPPVGAAGTSSNPEDQGNQPNAQSGGATKSKDGKATDADKIKKPILMVKHGKKSATLLLDRRPEKEGYVFIRYDEGKAEIIEIAASALKIEKLIDASK